MNQAAFNPSLPRASGHVIDLFISDVLFHIESVIVNDHARPDCDAFMDAVRSGFQSLRTAALTNRLDEVDVAMRGSDDESAAAFNVLSENFPHFFSPSDKLDSFVQNFNPRKDLIYGLNVPRQRLIESYESFQLEHRKGVCLKVFIEDGFDEILNALRNEEYTLYFPSYDVDRSINLESIQKDLLREKVMINEFNEPITGGQFSEIQLLNELFNFDMNLAQHGDFQVKQYMEKLENHVYSPKSLFKIAIEVLAKNNVALTPALKERLNRLLAEEQRIYGPGETLNTMLNRHNGSHADDAEYLNAKDELEIAALTLAVRRACKFGLVFIPKILGGVIHYELGDIDMAYVIQKTRAHLGSGKTAVPITTSELRFLFRHWKALTEAGISEKIKFYCKGQASVPPWETNPEIWCDYAIARLDKLPLSVNEKQQQQQEDIKMEANQKYIDNDYAGVLDVFFNIDFNDRRFVEIT